MDLIELDLVSLLLPEAMGIYFLITWNLPLIDNISTKVTYNFLID